MTLRHRLRELRRALSPTEFLRNCWHARELRTPHPVPPSTLRVLAIASANLRWYLEFGRRTAGAVVDTLSRNGVDPSRLQATLDFGCGAGRVIRHLPPLVHGELWGADFNGRAIAWCRKNLPFARFVHNAPLPPLPERRTFDLVCALSVFTHLTARAERAWIDELTTVMAPGGHLLVTLRGRGYRDRLTAGERALFDRGELVVRNPADLGRNECDSYHPLPHIERTYLAAFDLVAHLECPREFLPRPSEASDDPGQDVLLLRRKAL